MKRAVIWYADDEPTNPAGYVPRVQCREEKDNEDDLIRFVRSCLRAGKRFIFIKEVKA